MATTLYDDAAARFLKTSTDLSDYFAGLKGTSTGLSPATMSTLTGQAIDSVPARFDRLESDLATQLQRQNPTGLPMGGEFLRAYAPLEAEKETLRSGLLRDITLADEAERRRTGDLNNQYALSTLGQSSGLFSTLEGASRQQSQFDRSLTSSEQQAALNRENAIRLAEIGQQGPDTGKLLLSSLISAAISGKDGGFAGSLADKGVDKLVDVFTGAAPVAATAAASGAPAAAASPASVAGAGGLGFLGAASLVAAPAVAALLGAQLGQAKDVANIFTEGFQTQWGNDLVNMVDRYYSILKSGQLDKASASQFIGQIKQQVSKFEQAAETFVKADDMASFPSFVRTATQKGRQRIVDQARAAMSQWFGSGFSNLIGGLEQSLQYAA